MRTREFVHCLTSALVYARLPKYDFPRALRADENVRPDCEVDFTLCASIKMQRFIHPTTFRFDFGKNFFGFFFEIIKIDRGVVIKRNKGRHCREVI